MSRRTRLPKKWSEEELQAARDVAEEEYVLKHEGATKVKFAELYREVEPEVEALLVKTQDLLALDGAALSAHRDLWQTLRFCCAPPVSEENIWTFVGRKFSGALPVGLEAKTAAVLADRLDLVRFPWLTGKTKPTDRERHAAIMSTAILMTNARFTTQGRGAAARRQEDLVHAALVKADYSFDPNAKRVDDLQSGSFCREKTLFNKKCDVPVRLHDRRLLTLECKVSNTPKNSWKRLNQEAVGKSNTWRKHLRDQVVTGCVLAGVYDLQSLVQAQEQGIFIFWEHDLASLVAFVMA